MSMATNVAAFPISRDFKRFIKPRKFGNKEKTKTATVELRSVAL